MGSDETKLQKLTKWLKANPEFKSPSRQRDFLVVLIGEIERIEAMITARAKSPQKSRGTFEEVSGYAVEIELPATDGDWFFDKMTGSGWRNDGKPVADWKAVMRVWKRLNLFPSLRVAGGPGINPTVLFIAQSKELDGIEKKLEILEGNHSGMQNWEQEELDERKALRIRRKELKAKMEQTI